MPKKAKRISKTGKQFGRPKKYANPKEKFTVYNKKRPAVRLYPDEEKIILWLREDPKRKQKILAEIEMGF